jgi:SAM-dependent methyltransferase
LSLPADPVLGLPARRHLWTVSTAALIRYWRPLGADLTALYAGHPEIRLYEAENGLQFTLPAIAGGMAYYDATYRRMGVSHSWSRPRDEHRRVADATPEGARVLDVGCGDGVFGRAIGARALYTGIDLAAAERPAGDTLDIRRETLEAHLARGVPAYDVVAAFHVIEHLEDPVAFARALTDATRPGGRVVIAVPMTRSKMIEVPLVPVNIPPHHLTLWTEEALRDLAARVGLEVERIESDLVSEVDDSILWMHRFSALKTRAPGSHLRLDGAAVASGVVAGAIGWSLGRLFAYPRGPGDALNILLTARRPA